MLFLVIAMMFAVVGLSAVLTAAFREMLPIKWWLIRLGALPMIFLALAVYILAFPTPLPTNYDPYIHGNPGRRDFVAVLFWSIAAPLTYLTIALPVTLVYAF